MLASYLSLSALTKHLLPLLTHLSSKRLHIDFPPSPSVLFTFFSLTSSVVHLNSKNRSQWTPKEMFTDIPRLFLWSLAEVGMKINWIGSHLAEKQCFQCTCSLYFWNHTGLLWPLNYIHIFQFSHRNIKPWPCFWGLMWTFMVAPFVSRPAPNVWVVHLQVQRESELNQSVLQA